MIEGTSRWVPVAMAALLAGCIVRYPAPEEPVTPTTPYSALALYREVLPPVRTDGAPLPRSALRVAVRGDAVFADVGLIDGPEHAALSETWPGVRALLQSRREAAVVLLASAADLASACERLPELRGRALLAVRDEDSPLYPLKARAQVGDGESADRLRGAPLSCP